MSKDLREFEGAQLTIFPDAPSWDGQRTAAIGKFWCEGAAAGAAALQAACDELARAGYQAVLGPMEGDTWHAYRVVLQSDETPSFVMEPTSGAADLAAFQKAGFTVVSQYFSARVAVETALGDAPKPDPSVVIEAWDGQDPEAHFGDVHALSCRAFAGNPFYKPIEREAFLAMYMPFVPVLKPELILLARDAQDGRLLGFLFGIPNYAEGATPRSVILKTYASLRPGVGHALSHAFHLAAQTQGFPSVIHALIHEDNRSSAASRMHGAQVFRRYGLMGRRLDV